jgi:hypothetical protein
MDTVHRNFVMKDHYHKPVEVRSKGSKLASDPCKLPYGMKGASFSRMNNVFIFLHRFTCFFGLSIVRYSRD